MASQPNAGGWQSALATLPGDRTSQEDKADVRLSANGVDCLLVVADGLGGHQGGAQAAMAAVDEICLTWENNPEISEAILRRCVVRAHNRVAQVSQSYADEARTTCVAAVLGANIGYWAHMGDSRLYGFRHGDAIHRTKDHSVARLLIEMGELSEEEGTTGPDQGRLYKTLGPETSLEFKVEQAELGPEDGFLLCTDGFWTGISEIEMGAAMWAEDLQAALDDLAQKAVARASGRSDNVTVCAARKTSHTKRLIQG